ncbi:hypothetical protein GCM10027064_24440 [Microbacterium petrolearium]
MQRHRARLTVVMPVAGFHAPWAAQALDSVLDESELDLQVILALMPTARELRDSLERRAGGDARMRCIDVPGDAPVASVREHVDGEFVCVVGADELVPAGSLRALVDSLAKSRSEVALGDCVIFHPGRTHEPNGEVRAFREGAVALRARRRAAVAEATGSARGLMRRSLWERAASEIGATSDPDGTRLGALALRRAGGIDVLPEITRVFRPPNGVRGAGAARTRRHVLIRAPRRAFWMFRDRITRIAIRR